MEGSLIVWEGAREGTHHIVEADAPALKKDLAREPVHKGKPELGKQREGWEEQ